LCVINYWLFHFKNIYVSPAPHRLTQTCHRIT
jgi:hypothetical protein